MGLNKTRVMNIVKDALKEDIGIMDITTTAVIQKKTAIRADIIVKEDGVACGLPICEVIFEQLDKDIKFKPQVNEGDHVHKDKALCYLDGPARAILTGERVALNFLGRLSGIASFTRKFVDKAAPYGVKIMDTRKTTPCLRHLEKYAAHIGGGVNHRMGLWDQVLIKDNHIKLALHKGGNMSAIIKDVRKKVQKNIKIEIEIDDIKDMTEALRGKPDIIMLDNMSPVDIKKAVEARNKYGKAPFIEVSGNVTLDNVEEYAACKPDAISVGAITHSAPSLDISMEIYGHI